MMKGKNYHVCFIGPVDEVEFNERFPNGEGSIRSHNDEGFYKAFGRHAEMTASGWGVSEVTLEDMRFCWHKEETRIMLIKSYLKENKPFPSPAYDAFYMLYKEVKKL